MRSTLFAMIVIVAVIGVVMVVVVEQEQPLPLAGPSVEPVCAEAMKQSPPTRSWIVAERSEGQDGEVVPVTLGDLPLHGGDVVRVAGVLHAEFEWVGLYPSRASMEERWRGPWVSLGWLWPEEPYWRTTGPLISDRCVVIEGPYRSGRGGHFGMFDGEIHATRLEVWDQPHRPFRTLPPLPPAPPRQKS